MKHAIFLSAVTLCFALVAEDEAKVTDAEKQAFIALMKTLPVKGEFFADEGVEKAAPFLRVFLALNEADLKGLDLYPFGALSNQLCGKKERREYIAKNFDTIAHPELKLGFALVLFSTEA